MMENRKIIIGLVAVFVVFLLVIWIASWVGNNSNSNELTTTEIVSLAASADTELVTRITTSGEIINDEDYSSIRISVSRNQRVLEIMSGYNNVVIERVNFKNNQLAFESFLLALEKEGFTESREGKTDDERGFCATQSRTVYEILGNVENQQRLWWAPCATKSRTFDGNPSSVEDLFEAQIPDYSKLTKGIKI